MKNAPTALGEFWIDLRRKNPGDHVTTHGVSLGTTVILIWKGKSYCVIHVPQHAGYWSARRHWIRTTYGILRLLGHDAGGINVAERVKDIEPGHRARAMKRELIDEARKLDGER
jgi:hypothetical protein